MKKLIGLVIAGVFVFGAVSAIDAATVNRVQTKQVINTTHNTTTVENRIFKGYAAHAFGTFWDNDWDNASIKRVSMSDTEKQNLQNRQFSAGTTWYYDAENDIVSTQPFENWSEQEYSTSSATKTYVKDGVMVTEVSTNLLIETTDHVYQVVFDGYDSSPIVLDVNGDKLIDVANREWTKHAPKFYGAYAKFFDITGDGSADYTEWVASNTGDALLVMPENGEITSALQLFGTAGGYTDGYEKLSIVCDKDKNGWVEGEELEGLALWIDGNSDGIAQPEEIRTLEEFGISSISTAHNNYTGIYKTSDGETRVSWDWWPCVAQCRKFEK